jgi:hypothetical protein
MLYNGVAGGISTGGTGGVPTMPASGDSGLRTLGSARSCSAGCRFCLRLASAPVGRSPGERSASIAATVLILLRPVLAVSPMAVANPVREKVAIDSAAASRRRPAATLRRVLIATGAVEATLTDTG